jgi:hypothetical protein
MKTKDEIVDLFKELSYKDSSGIERFLSINGKDEVFDRLSKIEEEEISAVQFNQLFILSGLKGFNFDFFSYYWLESPTEEHHPYDVTKVGEFHRLGASINGIETLEQLRWGLYRLYVDSLLFFGDINIGYNYLYNKSSETLKDFFESKRFQTTEIKKRGKALEFEEIPKNDRYMLSEMVRKTYELKADSPDELSKFLIDNYKAAIAQGKKPPFKINDLLEGKFIEFSNDHQTELIFERKLSITDILEETIINEEEIKEKYQTLAKKCFDAGKKALQNTNYYLSLVDDLDVYVATSMREKKDFIEMANNTELIFKDTKIKNLNLRYFDPTISAANRHEDKGLIECLMVKCAKVLIYSSGNKDSYGKDAEAAMALSSGKPVIFFCPDKDKYNLFSKIHPLTRLVDFNTGVATGALIARSVSTVVELLHQIFNNTMGYQLEQDNGYFKLKDKHTNSVIRVQTNDTLLSKSFWNFYQKQK